MACVVNEDTVIFWIKPGVRKTKGRFLLWSLVRKFRSKKNTIRERGNNVLSLAFVLQNFSPLKHFQK